MHDTITYAMNMMKRKTGYNLEGSITWTVGDPTWYVSMWTKKSPQDEPSTPVPIQEIDIEIILRDGGIVASVMRTSNLKQEEIARIMDTLLENIELE